MNESISYRQHPKEDTMDYNTKKLLWSIGKVVTGATLMKVGNDNNAGLLSFVGTLMAIDGGIDTYYAAKQKVFETKR